MSGYRRRLMGASRKGSGIDMSNYMTIEALEDGLRVRLTRTICEYSIDGGEWVSLGVDTYTPTINAGQIISFKANNPAAHPIYGIGTFTIIKQCNLKGNCMSMLAYDDAANMTTVKNYAFNVLFKECTDIINVEKGFLPATKIGRNSYYQMFYGCSNLITAPVLPVTSLGIYCCSQMFCNCSSLVTPPPELPALSTEQHCYNRMFYGCSKIEEAPLLPATRLRDGCYSYMFYGCSNLAYIKMLAPDISASECLDSWVNGVASSGTFVKNKKATWNVIGTSGVPEGWDVVLE
jgi:hypothetical protein